MDQLILATESCDTINEVVCKPANVLEFFEFEATPYYMIFAALIVAGLMFFAFRKPKLVPGKFQAAIESMMSIVTDGIAKDVIGPEGVKYVPYLLSIFFFVFIGNFFEVTPFINFPVTSRMAIPAILSAITWVLFVGVGLKKHGFSYVLNIAWPPGVPLALKPLVGAIELVSTFLVRPFSLAVRLFANMVAGHTMLALLLGSAGWFIYTGLFDAAVPMLRTTSIGLAWFVLGVAIFMFEILVGFLQAYIFTLLSAVYIETSIHAEH